MTQMKVAYKKFAWWDSLWIVKMLVTTMQCRRIDLVPKNRDTVAYYSKITATDAGDVKFDPSKV